MATNKNKSKGKKKKANDYLKGLEQEGRGLQDSLGVTNKLGLTGDAKQLDTGNLEALLDPNSGAYIGRRTDEDKNTLEALERQAQVAGNRSQEMSQLLGLFKDGLAGLNATENQALREQAQREVNKEYQTASYELQKAQARNRTRSGAAARQSGDLARDRARTQSQMEQDLLVKNIDIQDKRRNDYANVLGNVEQNEFARTNQALKDFADASNNVQTREQGNIYNTRNQLLDASKFNIGETNANRAANLAAATGLMGLYETKRTNDRSYELAKEGMANQRRASSVAATNATNNQQNLVNALTQMGNDYYGGLPQY